VRHSPFFPCPSSLLLPVDGPWPHSERVGRYFAPTDKALSPRDLSNLEVRARRRMGGRKEKCRGGRRE